jgi:uncharacterized protein (TIGR02284 family)
METRTTDITTLNTLIGTLLDSVEGYTESAEGVRDPDLRQRFLSRARERQQAVAELQATVARCGGNPEDDATTLGGIHRAFVNLKQAVTGSDDKAILNEVERGEDYLKEKFEAALQMDDLAPEARQAIQRAWDSVKGGHDEMAALKHRREGAEDYAARQTDTIEAREQEYASENERERFRRDDEPLV